MFCHKTTYLKMQKNHHKTLKVNYQSDASYNDLLQLSNVACPFTKDTCCFYWRKYTKVLVPWILSLCGHTSNIERFHRTRDGVLYFSFHPQVLQFMVLTMCISVGTLFGINYLIRLNLSGQYLNLKILSRKLEIFTVCIWYVEGSTIWANFHVSLVLLCILSDHADISNLTLYCSQLTVCYVICKNAENVEHLGYWLRVCHFLCHF